MSLTENSTPLQSQTGNIPQPPNLLLRRCSGHMVRAYGTLLLQQPLRLRYLSFAPEKYEQCGHEVFLPTVIIPSIIIFTCDQKCWSTQICSYRNSASHIIEIRYELPFLRRSWYSMMSHPINVEQITSLSREWFWPRVYTLYPHGARVYSFQTSIVTMRERAFDISWFMLKPLWWQQ